MPTIVFLESNKSGSSREAIRAAKELGYETILFTRRRTFLSQREQWPDVDSMVYSETLDKREIETRLQTIRIGQSPLAAVVSFIDGHVHPAAELMEKFCTSKLSTAAIGLMEDKIKTRDVLTDTSYSPFCSVHRPADGVAVTLQRHLAHLPLMLKSPRSTGSKDVLKADTPKQLRKGLQQLSHKYPDQPILLEEFLPGPQYLVEVIVEAGEVRILAVIEQEIQPGKRFLVTGYSVLQDMDAEWEADLHATVTHIVRAFGLETGACHMELRQVNDSWKLIEINPRISGGAMNQLLLTAYGVNVVRETLKLITGDTPDWRPKHRKHAFAQYLTAPRPGRLRRITGRNRAREYAGVVDVFVKPRRGQWLNEPLSMGDRYVYVIATGGTRDAARATAKQAAAEISFHTEEIE